MDPNKLERLRKLDTNKLMDVVQNYKQYGYDDEIRNTALSILEERGVDSETVKLSGKMENRSLQYIEAVYADFKRNSLLAFISYLVAILSYFLILVLRLETENLGVALLALQWIAVAAFIIFLVKSFLDQNKFYSSINTPMRSDGALIYFLIGMPLYIFIYFYIGNQMKEQMRMVR